MALNNLIGGVRYVTVIIYLVTFPDKGRLLVSLTRWSDEKEWGEHVRLLLMPTCISLSLLSSSSALQNLLPVSWVLIRAVGMFIDELHFNYPALKAARRSNYLSEQGEPRNSFTSTRYFVHWDLIIGGV